MHRDLLILTELADEKLKILVEEGESSAVYCVQLKVCAKLSEWYLLHVHTNLHALPIYRELCALYVRMYIWHVTKRIFFNSGPVEEARRFGRNCKQQ